MIAPDMATMLSFVVTDAALPARGAAAAPAGGHGRLVQRDHRRQRHLDLGHAAAVRDRGGAQPAVTDPKAPALADFRAALAEVLLDLAHQVVRDGEGAAEIHRRHGRGSPDDASARRMGLAIANSPLVKTAIAGGDANWGRVVMAVGKSGEPVEMSRLGVAFGGHAVARDGAAVPDLDEAPVAAHLAGREIEIRVVVGDGRAGPRSGPAI